MMAQAARIDLPVAALGDYLRKEIPLLAGEMSITPTSGGQSNPTFFLHFPDTILVLRTQPPGELAPSAHAIDREFRILSALHGGAVPVPRPLLFCADRTLIGTPFYVMACVAGTVEPVADLPGRSPEARRALYLSTAETLGALHATDWRAAGLGDYGREGGYYPRQFGRWARFWREQGLGDNPALDAVIDWLEANMEVDSTGAISHGDFRFANLILAPDRMEVAAVIDWELSTIGHPFFDLGYFCMAYHTSPEENGGLIGLDTAALGIPDKAEFVAAYCQRAGATETFGIFHQVFALFRATVGCESIAARAAMGQGTSRESGAFGRRMGLAYARSARTLIAEGER
jgi:aminoglycoside phosphotransferase (APT) family kinase protein